MRSSRPSPRSHFSRARARARLLTPIGVNFLVNFLIDALAAKRLCHPLMIPSQIAYLSTFFRPPLPHPPGDKSEKLNFLIDTRDI